MKWKVNIQAKGLINGELLMHVWLVTSFILLLVLPFTCNWSKSLYYMKCCKMNSNDLQFEFEGTVIKVDIIDWKLIHWIELNGSSYILMRISSVRMEDIGVSFLENRVIVEGKMSWYNLNILPFELKWFNIDSSNF